MAEDRLQPIWNHIPESEYGDGKDVTCKLLKREGQDIEYLYQQLLLLQEKSPVITTVNYNEAPINIDKSFGLTQYTNGENIKTWKFNEDTSYLLQQDFSNTDLIDSNKTTAYVDVVNGRVTTPEDHTTTETYKWDDSTTYAPYLYAHGPEKNMGANEYWYVSWNKDKAYNLTASRLRYEWNSDAPSVCRAETFKVPTNIPVNPDDTSKGNRTYVYLEEVTLNLKTYKYTGSPLSVEIRTTETKGKSKIPYPGNSSKTIAKERLRWQNTWTSTGLRTIRFQNKPKLQAGKTYAIVLRSPLTEYKRAYGWGGWSTHCRADPYKYGNAFVSYDNGAKWEIYGKSDKSLNYHQGRNKPKDFGFRLVYTADNGNEATPLGEYELYFNPIQLNPQEGLTLAYDGDVGEGSITWYISHDFKKWEQIGGTNSAGQDVSWYHDCEDKIFVFIKAVLKNGNSTGTGDGVRPYINQVTCHIDMKPSVLAYGRTYPFNPQTEPALGLNMWSSITALTDTSEKGVSSTVGIVGSDEVTEKFVLVDADNIKEYIDLYVDDPSSIFSNYGSASGSDIITMLKDTTSSDYSKYVEVVKTLEDHHVFILVDGLMPKAKYCDAAGNYNQRYYVPLDGQPAYPLISARYSRVTLPSGDDNSSVVEEVTDYSEWIDYTVSYNSYATQFLNTDLSKCDGDLLKFRNCFIFENSESSDSDIVSDMAASTYDNVDISALTSAVTGEWEITYNPIIITDLTNGEMPFYLDYKKELFKVDTSINRPYDVYDSDNDVKTHYVTDLNDYYLTMPPNCMMRRITKNYGQDGEVILTENGNYTVDYDSRKISLAGDLEDGENLMVEYIPNIRDVGLSLIYMMQRDDRLHQGYILPCTYQYRT
jgi:hypothetical protein